MFEKSDNANKININIKGINTNNHENNVPPPLHIIFNNHVQNAIYTALNIKIYMLFSVVHPRAPKQYILSFPKF